MIAHLSWTLHGFPLDPDPNKPFSLSYEDFLDHLFSEVQLRAFTKTLDRLKRDGQDTFHDPPSERQLLRFWFLLGQGYLQRYKWDLALRAFEYCEALLRPDDFVAAVHLYRSWSLAAHQANQFEIATRLYQKLVSIWKTLIARRQTGCLEEDAHAFLCNVLRQQANAWLRLGACKLARNLVEHRAQPLITRHFLRLPTPLYQKTSHQNELNWRLLSLYVPWELNLILRWQARLALEPTRFENDLYHALVLALNAARLSTVIPEGRYWTSDLYTAAAETQIQRCRLSRNRLQQKVICQDARRYLEIASRTRQRLESTKPDQLRRFVLALPEYELRYCELMAEDVLHREDTMQKVDKVMNDIRALQQEAQTDLDPSYQLMAARCAWLAGSFEAQRVVSNPNATEQALSWYNEALALIPKSAELATLHVQGILADIRRL